MKYIITETQYKLLTESIPLGLKRRLSDENVEKFVNLAEQEFPTLCSDFSDEFEYGDAVINSASDGLLMSDDAFFDTLGDNYDDLHEFVRDYIKQKFGEYLLNIYRVTCAEYD